MAEHDLTEGADELRFTRVFDGPRELVFRCMIDPDHLTHFWGPVGVSAPCDRMVVDARPGGVFETVMVNDTDGSEYPTRAVYDEVREPELLAWTESSSGMQVTTSSSPRPRSHRGADPSEVGARGAPRPRGPGRFPYVARPLRGASGSVCDDGDPL